MVGIEPTTQKPMVRRRRHLLKNLWGISPFDHLQKVNQLLAHTKPYNKVPDYKYISHLPPG